MSGPRTTNLVEINTPNHHLKWEIIYVESSDHEHCKDNCPSHIKEYIQWNTSGFKIFETQSWA